MIKCEWTKTILGGPKCGAPAVKGRSYCEDHIWFIYQKGTKRATRKKDLRNVEAVRKVEEELNEAAEELDFGSLNF
jgi:hypothetical protein